MAKTDRLLDLIGKSQAPFEEIGEVSPPLAHAIEPLECIHRIPIPWDELENLLVERDGLALSLELLLAQRRGAAKILALLPAVLDELCLSLIDFKKRGPISPIEIQRLKRGKRPGVVRCGVEHPAVILARRNL